MQTRQPRLVGRLVLLLSVVLPVTNGFAQEHGHGSATGHDYHENLPSVFFGFTGETRRDYGTTLGIGYERRVSNTLGVGVLAERTYGDLDFWVYAVPFSYRTGKWKLLAAPGIEDSDHGTEFLFRVGAEYAIKISDDWELAPSLSIDFVGSDQLGVIGVALAKGF